MTIIKNRREYLLLELLPLRTVCPHRRQVSKLADNVLLVLLVWMVLKEKPTLGAEGVRLSYVLSSRPPARTVSVYVLLQRRSCHIYQDLLCSTQLVAISRPHTSDLESKPTLENLARLTPIYWRTFEVESTARPPTFELESATHRPHIHRL
jgi:hypothetical protein